jgi:hypothetical protein
MLSIDVRTLVFAATLVCIAAAVTTSIGTLNLRTRARTFLWWSLGFSLRALGLLGLALRGKLPDFLSQPVANTLIVVGLILFAWGNRGLDRKPSIRFWPGLVAMGVVFGIYCAFDPFGASYNLRVLTASLFVLAVDLYLAVRLLVMAPPALRLQKTVAAVFFLMEAVLMVVRCLLTVFTRVEGLFAVNPGTVIVFLDMIVMPICFAVSLLTMAARQAQLERDATILELEDALHKVKTLSGLLPICASCKRIRDEKGDWQQVELYVHHHSQADFSHSICPDCAERLYPELKTYPAPEREPTRP